MSGHKAPYAGGSAHAPGALVRPGAITGGLIFPIRARVDFVLGSALVFAGWAVLGAYRVMCQELQVRTTPWAWLVFSLFLTRAARGPERAAADEFCYCFGAVALPDTRASGSPGGD